MLLRLIRRHDFPARFGEEVPVDAKLPDLLQAESVYLFLSKDGKECLPLFHDKLLLVDGEDTISELEMSASFSLSFTFDGFGFRSFLLSVESAPLESENIAS